MLIRATQGKPCRSTRNYQEVEPQSGQGRPGAASPHDCSTEYCARSFNRFTQSAVDSTGQPREFDARRQQGAASLQQLFAFGIVHMDVKLENATLPRIRRHVSAGWWRSVCVFLHAMTSRNPVERPSLAELLQHPHLQPARHCVDSQVAPRCSNLQPAILSANASLLGVAAAGTVCDVHVHGLRGCRGRGVHAGRCQLGARVQAQSCSGTRRNGRLCQSRRARGKKKNSLNNNTK